MGKTRNLIARLTGRGKNAGREAFDKILNVFQNETKRAGADLVFSVVVSEEHELVQIACKGKQNREAAVRRLMLSLMSEVEKGERSGRVDEHGNLRGSACAAAFCMAASMCAASSSVERNFYRTVSSLKEMWEHEREFVYDGAGEE